MKFQLIKIIEIYQSIQKNFRFYKIPPFFYSECKFYPTCSDYTIQQIKENGATKGLLKGFWRVLKCNPLTKI